MGSAGEGVARRARNAETYLTGVGVHDAITARLAECARFDVVWVSSLEVSSTKLLPDTNLITFTEVAQAVREIRAAVAVPIIVDADNGYGSDETAIRAIREFAAAGADALSIEDNAFPKRNSFYAGVDRSLEEPDDFCKRLRLVHEAADDRLEVIARTEGLVAGLGVDRTLRRAARYVEAGADALFIQTRSPDVDEYARVLRRARELAPVMVTPTVLPGATAQELHEMGADVVIFSNVVIRAIVRALAGALGELRREERIDALDPRIAPLGDVFALTAREAWVGQPAAREQRTFGREGARA